MKLTIAYIVGAVFVQVLTSGCGGQTVDFGSFKSYNSRVYLVDPNSEFTANSIVDSIEVMASGTPHYAVRFLLADPLADEDEIEILAGSPVSQDYKVIFTIKKDDLSTGQNNDYWAALDTALVSPPFVASSLLTAQIRTAAQAGRWQFRHKKNGLVSAEGRILPSSGASLSVVVDNVGDGLSPGEYNFCKIGPLYSEIEIDCTILVADIGVFGTLQGAELLVLSSQEAGASTVFITNLNLIGNSQMIRILSTMRATSNSLNPELDSALKHVAIGLQRGLGKLRLTVLRGSSVETLVLNIGTQAP